MDDGWRTYFADFQNYLHLYGCIGMWMPLIMYVQYHETLAGLDATTILVNWINVLGYLKGFKLTGSLVRMLISVMLDMRGFVLLLFMLLFAFALAFTVFIPHEEGFGSIRVSSELETQIQLYCLFFCFTLRIGSIVTFLFFSLF